jgi:hypothetical protein
MATLNVTNGGNPNKPEKPKKEIKKIEFRVYTLASGYTGDLELIATIVQKYKDIHTDHGRPISLAKDCAEEYVRNIGMYGITIEEPQDVYNYYPPNRIAKVEYNEVEK